MTALDEIVATAAGVVFYVLNKKDSLNEMQDVCAVLKPLFEEAVALGSKRERKSEMKTAREYANAAASAYWKSKVGVRLPDAILSFFQEAIDQPLQWRDGPPTEGGTYICDSGSGPWVYVYKNDDHRYPIICHFGPIPDPPEKGSETMKTLSEHVIERIEYTGDTSAGAFNLAADLICLAAEEADGWFNCPEDVESIPHVLYEAADSLRKKAKEIHDENS